MEFTYRPPSSLSYRRNRSSNRGGIQITNLASDITDLFAVEMRSYFLETVCREASKMGCGGDWTVDDLRGRSATGKLVVDGRLMLA